jgi:acetyl-CoA carboxylase carboxyltransferase component
MNGKVVGVIANNPMVNGGADGREGRAQADALHPALRHLPHSRSSSSWTCRASWWACRPSRQATLREGMRCVYTALQATVPMLTVVIRKCYGMAGMATTGQERPRLQDRVAVAEWGSLPVEGGAGGGVPARDRERARSEGALAEIEAELRTLASPLLTAEAFASRT